MTEEGRGGEATETRTWRRSLRRADGRQRRRGCESLGGGVLEIVRPVSGRWGGPWMSKLGSSDLSWVGLIFKRRCCEGAFTAHWSHRGRNITERPIFAIFTWSSLLVQNLLKRSGILFYQCCQKKLINSRTNRIVLLPREGIG